MVTSIDKELLRIQHLIHIQNSYDFNRTGTPIYEIPVKKIQMLIARVTVQLKYFQELEQLP
jgi:hypothetical protein